ncbi:MAG TPA: alpha/beta hydrolase [Vicinamibacterales bacterium]|nr:alpha/beta hydrolase [Vicinamibacterales bacterium]
MCATDEGPTDALCGTMRVYENRATRTGRRIALRIIVLPAVAPGHTDPLFFLAGGPGQGAAALASQLRDLFSPVQKSRDIVLVDQRGTGKSHPLDCRSNEESLRGLMESEAAVLTRLRGCLAGYDADVRLYTTPIAMDDLDDVRVWLGYDRINLYGGSYGTRAGLVYLRRHESHVRTLVLDGVAPTDMRLPLFVARDAQRSLDAWLNRCDADASCRAVYPGMPARVRALLQRLDAAPVHVRMVHPRTGVAEDTQIDARIVASILFGALYSPVTASLLPTLIDHAEHDDFQSLLALGMADDASENMSVGMQLSVICSEDAPRVTRADLQRETSDKVFGGLLFADQVDACDFWPKGTIDASYYDPVTSDVPALVLSGEFDPITPPVWGQEVASHLRHSRHFTAASTGHGVIGTPCGVHLIAQFIEDASADRLDPTCLQQVKAPPFFLTPAGPDPLAGRGRPATSRNRASGAP